MLAEVSSAVYQTSYEYQGVLGLARKYRPGLEPRPEAVDTDEVLTVLRHDNPRHLLTRFAWLTGISSVGV